MKDTIDAILKQLKKDFPDYTFIVYNNKEVKRQQFPPQTVKWSLQ